MDIERRYLKANKSLRAERSESGGSKIAGYAAKFGIESEILEEREQREQFREILLPGCFDLENSPDIICNFDHDDCRILGRTVSGTLRVSVDDTGLAFECDAPNTTLGNDICELIARGDIHSNSFAFVVPEGGDEWGESSDGLLLRKINRCVLFDVAVVVHPAYPETELALRSLQKAKAQRSLPSLKASAWLRLADAESFDA